MTAASELEAGLYRHLRGLLPDGLLPAEGGSADGMVAALAGQEAQEIMLATLLLLEWLPQTASAEALDVIGAARGLVRYPGENLEAWRNRVTMAFDFWQEAGTLAGMTRALEHMGYGVLLGTIEGNTAAGSFPAGSSGGVELTQASGGQVQESSVTVVIDGEEYILPTLIVPDDYVYYALPPTRIVEHYHEDRDIWAEFSIYLTPSRAEFNADRWDDGSRWDDDSLWDLALTAAEVARILAVIREVKPAHARLRRLFLVSQFRPDHWDDGSNWDDQTVWDADAPTVLWERAGV